MQVVHSLVETCGAVAHRYGGNHIEGTHAYFEAFQSSTHETLISSDGIGCHSRYYQHVIHVIHVIGVKDLCPK